MGQSGSVRSWVSPRKPGKTLTPLIGKTSKWARPGPAGTCASPMALS